MVMLMHGWFSLVVDSYQQEQGTVQHLTHASAWHAVRAETYCHPCVTSSRAQQMHKGKGFYEQ